MKRKLLTIKNIVKLMILVLIGLFSMNSLCEDMLNTPGTIQGTVYNADFTDAAVVDPGTKEVTTSPIAQVEVRAYKYDFDTDEVGELFATVESDNEGQFIIENVERGWYKVLLFQEGMSAQFVGPFNIVAGNVVDIPPITLNPVVEDLQFRIVLNWTDPDTDLDIHVTYPTANDPCATIAGGFDGDGTGCTLFPGSEDSFAKVEDVLYKYPMYTDVNRGHIYPNTTPKDFDFDAGFGFGTAISLDGISAAYGPEILNFDVNYIPYGQILISVLNYTEKDSSNAICEGLGESGAVVRLYAPDEEITLAGETFPVSSELLRFQVGKEFAGNIWRIAEINQVDGDPATYVKPYNMYHYTYVNAYDGWNDYFNLISDEQLIPLE